MLMSSTRMCLSSSRFTRTEPRGFGSRASRSLETAPGEEAVESRLSKDERLKETAKSVGHQLTHIPEKKFCKMCLRSKQDALPARTLHVEHSLTDGEASKSSGDRVHVDHAIIAKDEWRSICSV